MGQAKISDLDSLPYADITTGRTEKIETSGYNQSKQRASFFTTLEDLGKAIFSKFILDGSNKTIQQKISEAKVHNEFTEIYLYDENNNKWKIWASSDSGVIWEDEATATWRQEMAEYMVYMNTPAAQDETHNYMAIYEEALRQSGFEAQDLEYIHNYGLRLTQIYNTTPLSEQIPLRDEWNEKQINFDHSYKKIRNKLESPEGEEDYYFDPEFAKENSSIENFSTRLNRTKTYIENNPVIIKPDPEDPTQDVIFTSDFQYYLINFADSILSTAVGARTEYLNYYTQNKYLNLVTKTKEAKSYLGQDKDIDFLLSFLTGEINDRDNMSDYQSFNTYKVYCLQTHTASDPSKQEELDGYVEDLNQLIDTIWNNIQEYFRQIQLNNGFASPVEDLRKDIMTNITKAKNLYLSATSLE